MSLSEKSGTDSPLYEEAEKPWVFSTSADEDTNNLFNFTQQITETTEKRQS